MYNKTILILGLKYYIITKELQFLEEKMFYTYILKCGDGSFYCGYTTDIENRVEKHNSGRGAKYTKSRLPVELIYFEEFETKSQALKRECAIKKLTREQKLKLVGEDKL